MSTDRMMWMAVVALGGSLLTSGCLSGSLDMDDDDSYGEDDDDDTTGDDDSAGDDDDTTGDDDTVGDDDDDAEIDDNTCDDGASASSQMTFRVLSEMWQPIAGAAWSVTDLDATSGELVGGVVAQGQTAEDGRATAVLDCAAGWMMFQVEHPQYMTLHAFFQVMPVVDYPMATVSEQLASSTVSWLINPSDEGLLGVYKATEMGSPDMQAVDSFSLDGGDDLIPETASNDIGMWIYDGALGNEISDIYHVDGVVPSHGVAGEMRYSDNSEGHVTRLFAPVWSYEDGDGLHLTALHVVD